MQWRCCIILQETILQQEGTKSRQSQDTFTLVSDKVELNENAAEEVMHLTAFGKACYDLTHSERVVNDLTFGRRVGLYELRGEISAGNFSNVRFWIHDLTKDEILATLISIFTEI